MKYHLMLALYTFFLLFLYSFMFAIIGNDIKTAASYALIVYIIKDYSDNK